MQAYYYYSTKLYTYAHSRAYIDYCTEWSYTGHNKTNCWKVCALVHMAMSMCPHTHTQSLTHKLIPLNSTVYTCTSMYCKFYQELNGHYLWLTSLSCRINPMQQYSII